jgi:hypothetical protein
MRQARQREAQILEALPCPARVAENERVRVGRLLRFTTKSAEDTKISSLQLWDGGCSTLKRKTAHTLAGTRHHKSGPD